MKKKKKSKKKKRKTRRRRRHSEFRSRIRSISNTISEIRTSINSMTNILENNGRRSENQDNPTTPRTITEGIERQNREMGHINASNGGFGRITARFENMRRMNQRLVNLSIPLINSPGNISSANHMFDRYVDRQMNNVILGDRGNEAAGFAQTAITRLIRSQGASNPEEIAYPQTLQIIFPSNAV